MNRKNGAAPVAIRKDPLLTGAAEEILTFRAQQVFRDLKTSGSGLL
jgi:hypothetical protein